MARKKIVQRMMDEDATPLHAYQIAVSGHESIYVLRASSYSIQDGLLHFYSKRRDPMLVATFKDWKFVVKKPSPEKPSTDDFVDDSKNSIE